MLGIGKYKAQINNMFFKGEAIFELIDNGGKYDIKVELEDKDIDMPEIIIAETSVEDNKCNGFLKIPFVGKVKIKDAEKIG